MITATRFHDFSYGHRVVGHENKCRGLHGHNGRVHFECAAERLDIVGRVIDFGVIKSRLCQWLEDNWDHKMLLWNNDVVASELLGGLLEPACLDSIYLVPFNPTAENMAEYLRTVIGPQQLAGTGVYLRRVQVDETRKCSAVSQAD